MVIRAASEKILATVEHITAEKTGDYGPYRSVLLKRSDRVGDDAKVWRSMQPHEAEQFQKGQQAYLIPTTNKKGRPSWDIELLGNVGPEQQADSPPSGAEIGQYIDQMTALYAACYRRASKQMDGAPDAAIQAAASSVFISTQRKFGLA